VKQLHPHVEQALARSAASYKVHRHEDFAGPIRNAEDFSRALGYEIGRITKTLFVRSHDAQGYAALVCSMDRRLDFKAAARSLEYKRLETASPAELEGHVGYPKNGVSPVGLPSDMRVLIDEGLNVYPTVLIGGGAEAIEVEISPGDLALVCGAAVLPITKQPDG
jgi:Cys-tRNA(Pro)/Cys-tRNA(Cys) deacylase